MAGQLTPLTMVGALGLAGRALAGGGPDFISGLLDQPFGFLDQPLDGVALLAGGFLADRLERLLEQLDLPAGFLEVILEGGLERRALCCVGGLGQRLGQRFLGVVDVLQCMQEASSKVFILVSRLRPAVTATDRGWFLRPINARSGGKVPPARGISRRQRRRDRRPVAVAWRSYSSRVWSPEVWNPLRPCPPAL